MKKAAIFGYGTVGKALEKLLENRKDISLEYVYVRKEKEKLPKYTNDIGIIDKVDIVFECLNGEEPAASISRYALTKGKALISSNKMQIAKYLEEYLSLQERYHGHLGIEATVAGGIPFIDALLRLGKQEEILGFEGILNGTSNFILSKMQSEKMDFKEALSLAQELGYAEKDPSSDIEGTDVRFKVMIANALAYRNQVRDIENVEGITKIGAKEIAYGEKNGKVLKLLGISKKEEEAYDTMILPCFLPKEHFLANIPLNYNGQLIHTAHNGDLGYYGQGAGGDPTASAMLADALAYLYQKERKIAIENAYPCAPLIKEDYVVYSKEKLVADEYKDGYCFFKNRDSAFLKEIKKKDKDAFIALWR